MPDEGRSEAPIATTEPTLQVAAAYDEPYEFGRLRPTVDRPGPFSFREYVRLQLLRIRVEIEASPLDAATVRTEHPSLSAR